MTNRRRVVVTGLGATTPLGGTVTDTWDALLAGRSGARPLQNDWAEQYGFSTAFAATIHTPPENVLSKIECRRMDPSGQYALVASREAWADSGEPAVEPERLGVVIGTGIGGIWTLIDQWDVLRSKGIRRVFPLTVPMLMPNSPAANVSLALGARAGAHATVSACASGAEAMVSAAEMIRSGRADIVVAGGTEAAVHPMPFAGFGAMQALSRRNEAPSAASRPYDVDRDGFVLGEGAAVAVLESADHAEARGARIYAELLGMGMSSDAHHMAAPDPRGVGPARAMQEAVHSAGLADEDVCHINAHATSTPVGDVAEAKAIRRAFGDHTDSICVSATKSSTGHLLGAAGAVEGIFTVLSLYHRIAPATINLHTLDPEIDLDVVHGEHRQLPAEGRIVALNNSFGFGGHNVALAFGSI